MATEQPPRPGAAAQTRTSKVITGSLGAAACAAMAAALATTGIMPDEGKWNIAKRDFARGIPTECFGHTGPDVRLGEHRTDQQCNAELLADVKVVEGAVAACVPALRSRPNQWAASTRLAFNIGPGAFCHSGAAIHFNRGDWRGGCDLFLPWDKARVGGRIVAVPGLSARRQRERGQCLTGLTA